MNEFEQQQPPSLRTVGNEGLQSGAQPLGGGMRINAVAELVVDLLAATGLVAPDKLALVRGRAQQGGSLSQAILDEGVATSEGIARALATRFQLPLIDLAVNPVDDEAAKHVPLHVLERVIAIP